jgi:Sugar kinases, ribokinase family
MDKIYDVIGIENLIMDFAVQIDHIPCTDGSARMQDFLWQCGGNASSAIVALARLGAKCGMLGIIGTDVFGQFCKDDLIRHDVDVSHIITQEGNTTFSICLAEGETEGRSFLGHGGVNNPVTEEQVDEAYIASASYLHTSMIHSSARDIAVRFARKNGVIVSLDAGQYIPGVAERLIADTDLLVMSEDFYLGLFGKGSDADIDVIRKNCISLCREGPQAVVVTRGKDGCVGADKHGSFALPSFSGYQIVDTTGAGDVYHGGFVYAHSQGWDTEYCAKFASAVSYINCTSLGGRVGIPTRDTVERFLKDGTIVHTDVEMRRRFYQNVMQFRSGHFC